MQMRESVIAGDVQHEVVAVRRRQRIAGHARKARRGDGTGAAIVVFAFAIGLATPNLGTVSRYRIPLLPFFVGAMAILEANFHARNRPRFAPAAVVYGPATFLNRAVAAVNTEVGSLTVSAVATPSEVNGPRH